MSFCKKLSIVIYFVLNVRSPLKSDITVERRFSELFAVSSLLNTYYWFSLFSYCDHAFSFTIDEHAWYSSFVASCLAESVWASCVIDFAHVNAIVEIDDYSRRPLSNLAWCPKSAYSWYQFCVYVPCIVLRSWWVSIQGIKLLRLLHSRLQISDIYLRLFTPKTILFLCHCLAPLKT